MTDFTRQEVIGWCKDNNVNFLVGRFPPPNGWMWAEGEMPSLFKYLTAIFTNTTDADVHWLDVHWSDT